MREFDEQLLRLKYALGLSADQDVASVLGFTKTAFSERKKRGVFPADKVRALAGEKPELRLDVDYVLTGTSDAQKELNRRLAIIKTSTEKALKLAVSPEQGSLLQAIIFFIEMEDRDRLQDCLKDMKNWVFPMPPDEQALLDDYRRIDAGNRPQVCELAARLAGDSLPPIPSRPPRISKE